MKTAGFAAALFGLAFLVHLLTWRVRRPRRPIAALLVVFLGTLVAGLLAAPTLPGLDRIVPRGPWEVFHVSLFHVAFALAYTVTYTALEMDSPTLTVIAFVDAAGPAGRTHDELLGLLGEDRVLGERLDALTTGSVIAPDVARDGVYVLTAGGRRWADVFHALRRLYRLEKGG